MSRVGWSHDNDYEQWVQTHSDVKLAACFRVRCGSFHRLGANLDAKMLQSLLRDSPKTLNLNPNLNPNPPIFMGDPPQKRKLAA